MSDGRLTKADIALFEQQAIQIDACLDQYIPAGSVVALLQFPFDFNVGCHMMWVAAVDYLKERGVRIAYAAHGGNLDVKSLTRAVGDGVILFLGGVTMSRLWPRHAEIKRIVAAACPNNRLISLPSTMLFVDDEDRREAGKTFGSHRDVVLMARDPVSAESARAAFPDHIEVVTIHDSTLRLPPQPRLRQPERDILWLARDDMEGVGFSQPADVEVFDWPHQHKTVMSKLFDGRVFSRVRKTVPAMSDYANTRINTSYERFARFVMAFGNERLDSGKVLVTDRLHPHILCALRAQHSVLLPDRFGKNRAVYDYSTANYDTVHWADTAEEALEKARALAGNS